MAEWSRDQIIARIRGEADRQKVDPDLALAIATQESSLIPDNHGDNGRSRGLFHLQEAAAIDAGVNPKWRDDPDVNIYGGVRYIKQKLDQSKGNVEEALRRYNGGGDPNYVNHVLRHYNPQGALAQQQPTLLQQAARFIQPRSAEAAERPQPGTYSDADVQNALKTLGGTPAPAQPQGGTYGEEDVQNALKVLGGTESATAPAPPTATSTPAQDAAYRDLNVQQGPQRRQDLPPVSQTAPAPQAPPRPQEAPQTPDTSWTPGMRFQALPSITQLEPADRMQKTKLFESLDPASQTEFLKSEEPASDLVVDIEKPSTPQPGAVQPPRTEAERQTRVREELAAWEQQAGRPWREGDPRMPSEKKLGVPDEAPVTEGFTTPSTLIPLIMGMGIPGLTTAAPGLAAAERLVGKAGPLITRGARAIGEGLSQTLGWGTGRTIETGQVPSPGKIGTEAALNVAAGGIFEGLGATGQAILRRSQAGRAIKAADDATKAAHATWQADTQAAEAAAKSQQKELYDTAVIKAKASQRDYEMAVRARQEKIAAGRKDYDEAVRAQQADDLAKEQARQQTIAQRQQEYQDALRTQQADDLAKEQARTQTITQQQQTYQQAIAGQQQAITTARATPGRYTPETPSWVQYEKFGDAAKDAVVDLAPAKAALAEVRATRGVLPDGSIRPFPQAVESIAANLEKATGETSFKTIREELRRLGPLTKSQDGNVRGAAKQLYGIYADVLEASPIANDLLKNANATFRKEMAVQDIAEWLRPGHGIVRIDNMGRETINVGALMTRLEKTIADDSLFRRSFAPDELDALRADLRRLAGTPAMPRQAPRAPAPVVPGTPPAPPRAPAPITPGRLPAPPSEPAPVALPADVRVKQVPAPRQTPAPPRVTPREQLGERPRLKPTMAELGGYGTIDALASLFGVPRFAILGGRGLWQLGQQGRYGMARAMLSKGRPSLLRALADSPTISPRIHATMMQGLSQAERKALLRETSEAREKKR